MEYLCFSDKIPSHSKYYVDISFQQTKTVSS